MTEPGRLIPPPPVIWRPAYSTRGGEILGFRSDVTRNTRLTQVTRHAVRNGRTLCGRPVTAVQWADNHTERDELTCSVCAVVPPGRLTHYDILAAAGITYRQLDWWSRKGWLKPDNPDAGSGRLRTFPPEELAVAQVMGRLTAAGILAATAARAARNGGWLADGVRVVLTDLDGEEPETCP